MEETIMLDYCIPSAYSEVELEDDNLRVYKNQE